MKATVLVRPKDGILDPQGQAVERLAAQARLRRRRGAGRPGRRPRARRPTDPVEARAQVERMCAELLANPLIESVEIELGQTE